MKKKTSFYTSNSSLIFYVMSVLHKKSKQSLSPSTGRIGSDFFSKIGIKWGIYFSKKVPIFETFWFTPAMHRPLTVKGVYVVSHSWYVQVYELVCICFGLRILKILNFYSIYEKYKPKISIFSAQNFYKVEVKVQKKSFEVYPQIDTVSVTFMSLSPCLVVI